MAHRRGRAPAVAAAWALGVALSACAGWNATEPTTRATPSPTPSVAPTPARTPRPSPTPTATPTYTNIPDPELRAIIPENVDGSTVVVPEEVSLTPGDVGTVFGEHGARFRSLVIGFTEEPRLTVFAMRIEPPRVATLQLRRHLPEIGQYLGISELDPEPWELVGVAGTEVWVRGGDEATSPGTQIYTWAQDDVVFLLIGTDEDHNRAMISALVAALPAPTEPAAASPSASPGATPAGTGTTPTTTPEDD